jgi:pyruvate dehydrogenase E2 component (dihydrolipoamide acetyltransferase)
MPMPVDVVMPRLSDTMTEGELVRWLKKPGDPVRKGDALAEVETDKATMEVEAFEEGTLDEILLQEGQIAPVGSPIARLAQAGKTVTQEKPPERPPASPPPKPAQPPREQVPEMPEGERRLTNLQDRILERSPGEIVLPPSKRKKKRLNEEEPKPPFPSKSETVAQPLGIERIKASPRAKTLAQQHGLNLESLQGSGPEGRILEADVQSAIQPGRAQQPEPERASEQQELSKIRKTIARRMTESKQQIPHFYISASIRADALVKLRADLQARFDVSYNDFVINACALALHRHPHLNASFRDDRLVVHESINIAQAVAVPDGLMTPVLHETERLSLEELAEQSAELVARTRSQQLTEHDLTDGTFTISNMGMYKVEDFIAIINPPQVAILAVGAIRQVPVVESGMVIPGYELKLTLSADHRALNGIEAAEFMATLQHLLENPVLLAEATALNI